MARTSQPRRSGDHLWQLLGLCRGCTHGIYDDSEVTPVAAECHLGSRRCWSGKHGIREVVGVNYVAVVK